MSIGRPNVSFDYDSWNYGLATAGLLNNYTNVIEIWDENFGVYNDDAIRTWIEGAGNEIISLQDKNIWALRMAMSIQHTL
ncbi:MAG: hypothetical protein U5J96_17415 [Ignavibacteriaceae bacterium]|nr:hypothetical protein [Ignavibacteriaceae bacterium]